MRPALLLALLLAGCAAPAASVPPPAPSAPLFAFDAGVLAPIGCAAGCYEPSIVADPQGRIMLSDGTTSDLARSEDGGATWTSFAAPPVPDGLDGFQADVLLQLSPAGRLYYSALVVRSTGIGFLLEGIQVAWSDDGGATWAGDTYVAPTTDPTASVYSPDRQWLAFGAGETMYMTYNQIPTGIWIARSDDGGATWSAWARAVSVEARGGGVGQSGAPIVDARGRVIVPACADNASVNAVFVSEDEGRTFARHDITAGCSWFPMVALAPDGSLVAAWQDGRDVHVATSADAVTWSEPVLWGKDGAVAPWPLPGPNGTLALAWFARDGTNADLHVSRGTLAGGPAEDAVVVRGLEGAGRTPANTDFASAAWLADGRIGAVWTDGAEILFAASTA